MVKEIFKRFARKYFRSQIGQDRWVIFHVLPFKRKGFFLDLAATNGISISNTYALEKLFAWKGICIEPNPMFHIELKKVRRCIIDSSVINDKSEKIDFRIDNGICGGIVAEDTMNNYRVCGEGMKKAEIISLTSYTLTEVLDRHNAPKVIDYFSLDVEGSELRVLRGLDFNKYSFKCLTVEAPTLEVHQILLENNYVFVKNIKHDGYYVHKTLLANLKIKLESFTLIPRPN